VWGGVDVLGLKNIKIVTITIDGKEESAKECRGCQKVKSLFDYYNQKNGLGGKTSRCKDCEHIRKGYTNVRKPKGSIKTSQKAAELKVIFVEGVATKAKECKICSEVKVLDNFYKNKATADGFDHMCKSCERVRKGSKKRIQKWTNQRLDSALPESWVRLEDVINGQGSVLVECENGHQSRRRPSDLENKEQGCLKCIEEGFIERRKKWTNEYLDTELKEKKPGWKRVGNVISVHNTVTLLCEKDHINQKAPSDIFRTGCPVCSMKEKWTNERLESLLSDNWERLDDVEGAHKPVRLKCEHGHVFRISPGNFCSGGSCVVCNARTALDYGKIFERLVDELLVDLKINYKKGYNKEIRPDYVLNNNIWMDAKLSRWTITQHSCKTVEKYESYCNLLNIVYLRGEKLDKMITSKTRILSVHLLIKQLPKHLQKVYTEKCNEIEELLLLSKAN
jgi:ribosomal protein L17